MCAEVWKLRMWIEKFFVLMQAEEHSASRQSNNNATTNKLKLTTSSIETTPKDVQKSTMGARATDSARVMKFTKELSGTTVVLGMVAIGLPSHMI